MRRAILLLLTCAVACAKPTVPTGGGGSPAVVKGSGLTITADELKARIEEQSPMVRSSFSSPERKRQFLDNLIRFELLAKEAEKEGLGKDPEVQFTMKKVMVSKFYQRFFQAKDGAAKPVPDAEVQKYYEEHKDEYHRPARLRVAHILVKSEEGAPERARAAAIAKKLLARVQAEEKKSPNAFTTLARETSDDVASKAAGGDLGLLTVEELGARLGKEAAEVLAKLPDGATAPAPVESKQGFDLLRLLGRQPEVNQPLDTVKPQILARLESQRKTKDFEDYLKKLREDAKITVDEAALDKVAVSSGPAGMPSGPGGMGRPRGPAGAMGRPGSPGAGSAPMQRPGGAPPAAPPAK